MRPTCLLLIVLVALTCHAGTGNIEDFDPQHPPLLEVGKKYRVVISPGKKANPVVLIFQSAEEYVGENGGNKRNKVLSQEDSGSLSFDLDGFVPTVDIVDYDRDGYRDFRVTAGWGSGGTWYNYYRFDGKRYVPWLEPERLNITSIRPEESLAVSFWRSGPSWKMLSYRMQGARFILIKVESYGVASESRKLLPSSIPDGHYVLITETIAKKRIVHRNIKLSNPWEDERSEEVILDRDVDEPLANNLK